MDVVEGKDSLTTCSEIPKEVIDRLRIMLIGKPLAFFDTETRKIIRGWKLDGKIYLEAPAE